MIRSFSETKLEENLIPGVEFKELKTFADDRGFFREIIRSTDEFFKVDSDSSNFAPSNFAQWSHSKMARNTVKAWHYHHLQVDWWYVPIGTIHTVLFDNREESPTYRRKLEFRLGEGDSIPLTMTAVVKIPQGVLHGLKVLSDIAHLFYITSKTYNPDDEGRFAFDNEIVPHSWGENSEELIVAANDRKNFIPKASRLQLGN